ncbi:CynX/NimT family MFS transporter [Paenisporosarcina sp. TG20]|uniref:MFS transporter n=1 Tax=Paenisporosarcina sp. TG20 TaxID=1211706 RepID=UPI0003152CA3|nr:MFS transporter [Paenisporosarcina sp. TG20]
MNSQKSMTSLLLAIFLIALNLRPAVTSIGPLLDTIRNDLMLSNSEVSLLTAVPVICMGVFAPLAVHWLNKFGQKRGISLLLGVIGLLTLVRAWFHDYVSLLITAFVIGVAIAIIGPILSSMIKEKFPTRTATAIGIYSLGMGAGATLSAGLTGVLYVWLGEQWEFALAFWSSLALLAYLIWINAMKPQQEERLNIELQQLSFRSPWSNKRAWLVLLFFGFQASLFFSLMTWLASAASELGFSVIEAGTVLSVLTAAQIFANITIPLLLEKFPNRSFWIYLLLFIGATGIILLLTGNVTLIWFASILLGLTLGGLFPLALLLPLDETTDAKEANAWTAMVQTGGFIMGGIVPLAIGILYDWSGTHQMTYYVLLVLIVGMFITTLLLNRKTLHTQG